MRSCEKGRFILRGTWTGSAFSLRTDSEGDGALVPHPWILDPRSYYHVQFNCGTLKMVWCRFPAYFDCFYMHNLTQVAQYYPTAFFDNAS